ncbi:hypothetical protein BaRGS_00007476 [Batillaria attramentaria]|uniref:Uncharacterized protein n=1 Tax=Batillaria attramentaria TaxID=370345 RepID=A0ABD0LQ37_9CAEN
MTHSLSVRHDTLVEYFSHSPDNFVKKSPVLDDRRAAGSGTQVTASPTTGVYTETHCATPVRQGWSSTRLSEPATGPPTSTAMTTEDPTPRLLQLPPPALEQPRGHSQLRDRNRLRGHNQLKHLDQVVTRVV